MRPISCRPGSSPRMRGTPDSVHQCRIKLGIIPAYAGNTQAADWQCSHYWDHPRVCGEHLTPLTPRLIRRGSSPRMRGTRVQVRDACGTLGIIPAYAGNTKAEMDTCLEYWDHPRVCGEHMRFDAFGTFRAGSSPRMRGTPGAFTRPKQHGGIIPAYAGNTPIPPPTIRP